MDTMAMHGTMPEQPTDPVVDWITRTHAMMMMLFSWTELIKSNFQELIMDGFSNPAVPLSAACNSLPTDSD